MSHRPRDLAKRAFHAGYALVIHTALMLLAIGTVFVTEKWIQYLWSNTDPRLFDTVPYRFLFQTIEFGFIALFGGMGVLDAYHVLRGEKE
jgi:hypothetical protein